MATEKQIQANRQNARASTGPKTDAGKAAVALNATKLGIYGSRPVVDTLERADEWEEFRAGIVADLAPEGAFECVLAERVASCLWRMRRVVLAEAGAIDAHRTDSRDILKSRTDQVDAALAKSKECQEATDHVREIQEELAVWQDAITFLSKLSTAHDGDSVDGELLFMWLDMVSPGIPMSASFLESVRPPQNPMEPHPWARPGWTIAHARRAVSTFSEVCSRPLGALIREAVDNATRNLSVAVANAQKLSTEVAAQGRRMVRARTIPDDATVAKIARYESHLSRQMTQALHELQRLQAAGRGTNVMPPAALDVNVHAAEAVPINGFAKQSQFDGPAYMNGTSDTGGSAGFR